MKKSQDKDPEIILIYYNYKGVGQIIRLLLCYLELPFADVYIDEYETQKSKFSENVRKQLQANPVSPSQLPAIIHKGDLIYGLNQIMTYIPRAYDRQDLLGKDIQQKAQVCEIMEIYSKKIVHNIRFITSYASETYNRKLQGIELLEFVEETYLHFLRQAGYVQEIGLYLLKQQDQRFIFGNATIVDFYFNEAARHALSIFGSIDYQTASARWTDLAKEYLQYKKSKGEEIHKVNILRALKKYREFFNSQQFYTKNEEYLESVKVFSRPMPQEILLGVKILFAIDEKHLKR